MARENKSQYAILGLLSKRASSAYDMKQKINQIAHFHWSESNAQLYPELKRLEKLGMVQSELDLESGDRKKRLYQITPEGLAHLKAWLVKPAQPSQYREEMLLKLALAEHVETAVLMENLQAYLQQIQEQQKLLAKIVKHIDEHHGDRADQLYLQMTYDYADMLLKAKSAWGDKTLQRLATLKKC